MASLLLLLVCILKLKEIKCFILYTEENLELDFFDTIGYNDIYCGDILLGEKELIINTSTIPNYIVHFERRGFVGTVVSKSPNLSSFTVLTVSHDIFTVPFLYPLSIGPVWHLIVLFVFGFFVYFQALSDFKNIKTCHFMESYHLESNSIYSINVYIDWS